MMTLRIMLTPLSFSIFKRHSQDISIFFFFDILSTYSYILPVCFFPQVYIMKQTRKKSVKYKIVLKS